MKRYELVKEIFNQCSGNQMRDVAIREIETDSPRRYVEDLLSKHKVVEITEDNINGDLIFDVVADGLRERYSFTEI